ncbi:Dirigent protein 21 [Linum perenne]
MAKSLLLLLLLTTFTLAAAAATSGGFSRVLSPATLGLKKEKLSHLRFFFHDIVSGPNPTTARIAQAQVTNTSSTLFGLLSVIDDPLTSGPEPNSKLVGRAQGVYASASQSDVGLLMAMNFAFVEGRNAVMSPVREMPVIGGSGVFRFARGYAQAKTLVYDLKSGNAVVEYNVFVFHY